MIYWLQIKDQKLSYSSTVTFKQFVEALPSPPRWKKTTISYPSYESTTPLDFYYRDVAECLKTLFGNPRFRGHMTFAPRHDFVNGKRVYTEMCTGDRWWELQASLQNTYFNTLNLMVASRIVSKMQTSDEPLSEPSWSTPTRCALSR
jgi:hypothetical protein